MNVLCIGDPHFKTNNIIDVECFHKEILKVTAQNSIDLIIILGDILHTHAKIHITPLNKAYEFIDDLRKICQVIILVGNHDMINHSQFLTTNHWMNSLKEWENIIIADKVIHYKPIKNNKEYHIVCVPYVQPGRFIEALNTDKKNDWKKADLVCAHQEFKGCSMNSIESSSGDDWKSDYPFIVSGHIHDYQWLHGKCFQKGTIFYPGSGFQHAFGESSQRCVPLIDMNTKIITEFILNMPKKHTITIELNQIPELTIDNKDNTKLVIRCSDTEFKVFKQSEQFNKLIKKGVKISHKTTSEIELTEQDKMSFEELLYQKCNQNIFTLSDFFHIFKEKPKNYKPEQFYL